MENRSCEDCRFAADQEGIDGDVMSIRCMVSKRTWYPSSVWVEPLCNCTGAEVLAYIEELRALETERACAP